MTEGAAASPASRQEISARLTQLQRIRNKKLDDITEGDRQYLIKVFKYFNIDSEFPTETDVVKRLLPIFVAALCILTSAELSSLNLPDSQPFALIAVDAIIQADLAHDLGHLFDDITALDRLLNYDEEFESVIDSKIQREASKLNTVFDGLYDENKCYRFIFGGGGLININSRIILALIDNLIEQIEKAMATRVDLVKYFTKHRNELKRRILYSYLRDAKKAQSRCKINLLALKRLRQDVLQSAKNNLI